MITLIPALCRRSRCRLRPGKLELTVSWLPTAPGGLAETNHSDAGFLHQLHVFRGGRGVCSVIVGNAVKIVSNFGAPANPERGRGMGRVLSVLFMSLPQFRPLSAFASEQLWMQESGHVCRLVSVTTPSSVAGACVPRCQNSVQEGSINQSERVARAQPAPPAPKGESCF